MSMSDWSSDVCSSDLKIGQTPNAAVKAKVLSVRAALAPGCEGAEMSVTATSGGARREGLRIAALVQYFSPDGFDYDQSIRKTRATRRARLHGVISNLFAKNGAASVHL